jgi:hypothetical protein
VIAGERIADDGLQIAGNVTYNQLYAPMPGCVKIFTQDVSHDASFDPKPISELPVGGSVQTLSTSHASGLRDTGRCKMQEKMIKGTPKVPVVSDRPKRLRKKLEREALDCFDSADNLTDNLISVKSGREDDNTPKPHDGCLRKLCVYAAFRGEQLSKSISRQLARFPPVEIQSDSSTTSSWWLRLPGHNFLHTSYTLVGLAALSPPNDRSHEDLDSSTTSLWWLGRALCREGDSFQCSTAFGMLFLIWHAAEDYANCQRDSSTTSSCAVPCWKLSIQRSHHRCHQKIWVCSYRFWLLKNLMLRMDKIRAPPHARCEVLCKSLR